MRDPSAAAAGPPRRLAGTIVGRLLLHAVFLVIAIACLAGYEHFRVAGRTDASVACLVAAGLFGFAPLRDLLGLVFGLGGRALHLVHALGALGLAVLPLSPEHRAHRLHWSRWRRNRAIRLCGRRLLTLGLPIAR